MPAVKLLEPKNSLRNSKQYNHCFNFVYNKLKGKNPLTILLLCLLFLEQLLNSCDAGLLCQHVACNQR